VIRVDRCICASRTFASLRDQARAEGLSLDQLVSRCGAGDGCRTCLPYLRRTLRTGQTVFDELLDLDDEAPVEQTASRPCSTQAKR